jgi:LysM repeat protein
MTDKQENPQDVIESYRKRQQTARRAPLVFIIAAVLLIVGAAALIFWLVSGGGLPSFALRSTDTPTSTVTSTVTPTFTLTNTPTLTSTASLTPTITITPTNPGPVEYVVVEGDTCFGIAAKFNIDLLLLITINNLDANCTIQVGQKLIIPGPDTSLPTETTIPSNLPPGTKIEYVVKVGDTLATIAAKFNSTTDAIIKENKLTNPNDLLVGQKLIIPVNLVTPVPTATPTSSTPVATTRVPPTLTLTATRVP